MRARVVVTAVWGLTLGVWIYLDQKQIDLYSQGTFETLNSLAFELTLLAAVPILVGMFVRRWWVVAALLGPLASLTYLQLSGYVSPWHDGVPPLGFVNLVATGFQALPLLAGVGLGLVIEAALSAARSRRA